ncbi:MAG: nucleotidyl transferase AbiEii/AbiGii toxin family protein [bacterium]|nr:nucleotidyl transferase AbiEii/AbiGii toxin family protein [bacterium]
MIPRDPSALVTSIHDRLLNKAKAEHRPFQELLQYYAIERFLYRLSQSQHRDSFVLKGGLMLRLWEASFARPTLDIDLLGQIENQEERILRVLTEVCDQDVEPDGMSYDPASLKAERITEDAHYHGLRIRFQGHLGPSRVMLQIDIGFGDTVLPSPQTVTYPTLLDLPAPLLMGYSKESTVAEKLEAMVSLGMLNSRMKDYYDIWFLSQHFDFDGKQLSAAIRSTFEHRGTELSTDLLVLSQHFADDPAKATLWKAFRNRTRLDDVPEDLGDVLADLRGFLLPVLNHIVTRRPFRQPWHGSGPWMDAY